MDNSEENPKKHQKDLFYKQQQQRLQNITIKNNLSADDLIRNILEKVDSDAKISKLHVPPQRNSQNAATTSSATRSHESNAQVVDTNSQPANCLPIPQCFLMCNDLPAIYLHMWNASKQGNTTDICDRDKLYQVLLLSNLPSHVLAQLWAFCNRTIPGQLTKRELFVMLAMIGLIQRNSPDPVNELYKATFIPLPQFPQLAVPESNNPFRESIPLSFESAPTTTYTAEPILREPTSKNENDFADFKSANFATTENNSKLMDKFNFELTITNHKTEEEEEEEEEVNDSIDAFAFDFSPPGIGVQSDEPNSKLPADTPVVSDIVSEANNQPQWLLQQANNNSIPTIEHNEKNLSDRYRSLRALTTNMSDSEEFGDFYSHSTNDCNRSPEGVIGDSFALKEKTEVNTHTGSNKRKILLAICKVMQKTFNILIINHGEESVMEALNSKDGANFANDLSEVFAIAQRIHFNSVLNNPSEVDIFDEIANKWTLMRNLFRKSSPNFDGDKSDSLPVSTNDPSLSPGDQCSICSDVCHPTNSLLFAGFRYHSSCANFWLNYVNSSLPHNEDF